MGLMDKLKIQDVIMWDDREPSSNDIVVYKHEIEDFNKNSKLIVHENQIAVFFQNGQSLHAFGSGKHNLDTASNLPFLRKLMSIPTGGVTQYHCEVFFVNKVHMPNLGWGTPNPIQFRVDVFGRLVRTKLTAMGSFETFIEDEEGAKRVLELLNGTRARYTKSDIEDVLKGKIIEKITSTLGQHVTESGADIFNLASSYSDISRRVEAEMVPYFKEFGFNLTKFNVEAIEIPERDLEDIKDIEKEEFELIAQKRKYENLGENFFREQSIETMKIAAANEGMAGTFMGAGMGLGMGAGMGTAFGVGMTGVAQNAFSAQQPQQQSQPQPAQQVQGITCAGCGATLPAGTKFCSSCGKAMGNVCASCGASIPAGAKFCPECGAVQAKVCPQCGKAIAGERFCPECGTKI